MGLSKVLRSGLASAMVALFLAGSAGEAAGLHHCPHHDAVAGHSVHTDASHGEEDGGHGCTCFGTCQGSAAVALPTGPGDAQVRSNAILDDRARATSTPAARAPSYLHPYPNGPPTP
ncbi:MAG: hypothetical protein ACREK7_00565 [Gemmatimonadota bacterium]